MSRFVRLLALVCVSTLPVAAQQWSPYGNYTQTTTYTTTVQQPINADNSSVFAAKKGVIPVKFALSTGTGPLTIISATNAAPAYGGVTFTLPASVPSGGPLTLNNMGYLGFFGTIDGCGAGSPRFTLDYGGGEYMYIYLGGDTSPGDPNSNCANGAGINLLSSTTATRFEATLLGNTVLYDTLPDILSKYGDWPIQGMWFVTDNGNSQVTLNSVSIGNTTYTFAGPTAPTCNLPPATIDLTTVAGVSLLSVDETTYTIPADNGYNFRVDGCQYVYNLNAKPLAGGSYKVFVNVGANGDILTNPGSFALK
jgi:hypothetical protein